MKLLLPAAAFALLLPACSPAASQGWSVTDQTTRDECSACHIAYPPALLPKASWNAILDDLSNHFGEDASLPAESVAQIRAYLDGAAPATIRGMDPAKPILKISDFPWFQGVHGRFEALAVADPRGGTMATCAAEQGFFEGD
jgi:hypothetical protein